MSVSIVPIAMPGSPDGEGVATSMFEVLRVDYASPDMTGRFGGVSAGWPLWQMVLDVGPLDEVRLTRLWRAWLRRLRGQQGVFFARDLTRGWPLAYPTGFAGLTRAGGGGFPSDGQVSSWSLNSTRDALSLTGLPAGFVINADDQIGFRWQTGGEERRALAAFNDAVTADGSGVVTAVSIDPPLSAVVPGGAQAYFESPTCLMRVIVDPTSTNPGTLGKQDGVSMQQFTVTALQDLIL